jgi:MarR family transcriptional regulator, transcriptional regulator for hemolysin
VSEMEELRRSLGFLLQDTSRLMRRRFVQGLRDARLELNRSEAILLLHLFREPGISQATLASYLDTESISVVRLLDGLQAAGLIERHAHPTDRRIRRLWLTKAARPVITAIQEVTEVVRRQALMGIPSKQQDRLLDLLLAIRANLAPSPDTAGNEAA